MKAVAFLLLAALVCGATASVNTGQEELNQLGMPVHATLDLTGADEDLSGIRNWSRSYGEGRSLLQQAYVPTLTRYRFRVDGFADNTDFCANYNQDVMKIIRSALRATSKEVQKQLNIPGAEYDVVSLATVCNKPPDTPPGQTRKRIRSSIVLKLMSNVPGDFLAALRAKVNAGVFANYATQLGAGIWVPEPFKYNNGANAVCLPRLTATYGPCGGPWRPNRITPI